jgi:hypothetical protein
MQHTLKMHMLQGFLGRCMIPRNILFTKCPLQNMFGMQITCLRCGGRMENVP